MNMMKFHKLTLKFTPLGLNLAPQYILDLAPPLGSSQGPTLPHKTLIHLTPTPHLLLININMLEIIIKIIHQIQPIFCKNLIILFKMFNKIISQQKPKVLIFTPCIQILSNTNQVFNIVWDRAGLKSLNQSLLHLEV